MWIFFRNVYLLDFIRPGRAAGVYVQAARMSLVGGALLSYRTTNQVARLGWGT